MSEKTTNIIYLEAKDRLKAESLALDQISSKINYLFAFKAVILASIFSAQSDFIKSNRIAIALIFFSISFDLFGLWIREYRCDPDTAILYKKYKDKAAEYVQKQLILNLNKSIENNSDKRRRVATVYKVSSVMLVISLAILGMSLFFNVEEVQIWQMIIQIKI